MKGKKPQYDLKESKIYKTLKDASALASEVGAHMTGIISQLRLIQSAACEVTHLAMSL